MKSCVIYKIALMLAHEKVFTYETKIEELTREVKKTKYREAGKCRDYFIFIVTESGTSSTMHT